MQWIKDSLNVATRGKGMLNITALLEDRLRELTIRTGLCFLFLPHASASLTIGEGYDPSARADVEAFFDRLAPEGEPWYQHTLEGPDDSPSHIRASLTQPGLTIPIDDGRLTLGTWQAVYLFEHRARPHTRTILLRCLRIE